MKKGIVLCILVMVMISLCILPNKVGAIEQNESFVAMIGENKYSTLQQAFDAVETNNVTTYVDIINDVVMSTNDIAILDGGKNVVLNMNGKSITVDSTFTGRPIVNNGILKVIGNGVIDSSMSTEGYGAINNNGDLTIDDGTYSGYIYGSGACIKNNSKASLLINNGTFNKATCAIYNDVGATAVINNGLFDTRTCSACNSNIWSYTVRSFGTLTFNNGIINGVQGALAIAGGKAQINGGHFETFGCSTHGVNTAYYALYAAGERGEAETIVNGGKFISASKHAVLVGNDSDGGEREPAKCVIKNGEFITNGKETVPVIMSSAKTGDPRISGGTFCKAIDTNFIDSNYRLYDNGNRTYTVAPMTSKVDLSASTLKIKAGETEQLQVTLTPSTTLDKVTYTSSDIKIATVDANGKISAMSNGTAVITITAGDKTTSCDVSVYKVETPSVPNIDTSKPTTEVEIGVQDETSQEVIASVIDNVVDDIINGKTVSKDVIDAVTFNAIKEAIDNGKIVTPKVTATTIKENDVNPEVKTKVNNLVMKSASTNNTEVKVVQYLDLGITLIANNVDLGTINQLDKPILFTIGMPINLQKADRKFYIVRVHNEIAERLETTLNDDGTLTFMTDKFSTYALVYEDKVNSEIIPNIPEYPIDNSPKAEIESPVKTDDNNNIDIYIGVIIISLIISIYTLYMTKERES